MIFSPYKVIPVLLLQLKHHIIVQDSFESVAFSANLLRRSGTTAFDAVRFFPQWQYDHIFDVHVNMTNVIKSQRFLCRQRKRVRSLRESLEKEAYERSAPPRRETHMNTPVTMPLFKSRRIRIYIPLCVSVHQFDMCVHPCMLCVCPCVHVTVGSTLSTAVGIRAVVMGARSSSRCRHYHLSVTLHRRVAHGNKNTHT